MSPSCHTLSKSFDMSKKTPQNLSVGYISKAAYISWAMDSI